ncbi:MAG: hypothetical protein KGZ62_04315 [Sulfurimonas sp.]|nr:hypothetical protein [Sulfurimonas sp.]
MNFKIDGTIDNEIERIFSFISCFDLKVYLKSGGHGFIGKGSAHFLKRFKVHEYLKQSFSEKNNLLRFNIGRFNEFAQCKILIGGEHKNNEFFNNSFGSNQLFRKYINQMGINTIAKEEGIQI